MPRSTPVKELSSEDSVDINIPIRRSTRISLSQNSVNSPAPKNITTRRSSASSITEKTNDILGDSNGTPVRERRTTRRVSTDAELKPTPVRARRGSVSKIIEEETKPASTVSTPTRKSTRAVSTSPSKNVDVPARRTRRSISASTENEIAEEQLPTKRSTRRRSVDTKDDEKKEEISKPVTRRRRSSSKDEVEENVKVDNKSNTKKLFSEDNQLEPIDEQEIEIEEIDSSKKQVLKKTTKKNNPNLSIIEESEDTETEESKKIIKDIDDVLDDNTSTTKSAIPKNISTKSIFSPITPKKGVSVKEKAPEKLKNKDQNSGSDDDAESTNENPAFAESPVKIPSKKISQTNEEVSEIEDSGDKQENTKVPKAEKTSSPLKRKRESLENQKQNLIEKHDQLAENDDEESENIEQKILNVSGRKHALDNKAHISIGSDDSFTLHLNSTLDKTQFPEKENEDDVFSSPGSNKENSSLNLPRLSKKVEVIAASKDNISSKITVENEVNVFATKTAARTSFYEAMEVDDDDDIAIDKNSSKTEKQDLLGTQLKSITPGRNRKKIEEDNENLISKSDDKIIETESTGKFNVENHTSPNKSLTKGTEDLVTLATNEDEVLIDQRSSPAASNKSENISFHGSEKNKSDDNLNRDKSFIRVNSDADKLDSSLNSKSPISLSTRTSPRLANLTKNISHTIYRNDESDVSSEISIKLVDTDEENLDEENAKNSVNNPPIRRSKRPRMSDAVSNRYLERHLQMKKEAMKEESECEKSFVDEDCHTEKLNVNKVNSELELENQHSEDEKVDPNTDFDSGNRRNSKRKSNSRRSSGKSSMFEDDTIESNSTAEANITHAKKSPAPQSSKQKTISEDDNVESDADVPKSSTEKKAGICEVTENQENSEVEEVQQNPRSKSNSRHSLKTKSDHEDEEETGMSFEEESTTGQSLKKCDSDSEDDKEQSVSRKKSRRSLKESEQLAYSKFSPEKKSTTRQSLKRVSDESKEDLDTTQEQSLTTRKSLSGQSSTLNDDDLNSEQPKVTPEKTSRTRQSLKEENEGSDFEEEQLVPRRSITSRQLSDGSDAKGDDKKPEKVERQFSNKEKEISESMQEQSDSRRKSNSRQSLNKVDTSSVDQSAAEVEQKKPVRNQEIVEETEDSEEEQKSSSYNTRRRSSSRDSFKKDQKESKEVEDNIGEQPASPSKYAVSPLKSKMEKMKECGVNFVNPTPTKSKVKLDEKMSAKLDEFLSKKLDSLANNDSEDESVDVEGSMSEDYDTKNEFLDDMAEEGEEDTPSEGSNDIIDEGESINSTDSEYGSDESYDYEDSFLVKDDGGDPELLSGEEYDLDIEEDVKKEKQKPKKISIKKNMTRIIQNETSSSDDDIEEVPAKVSFSETIEVIQKKDKPNPRDYDESEIKISSKNVDSNKIKQKSPKTEVRNEEIKISPSKRNEEDTPSVQINLVDDSSSEDVEETVDKTGTVIRDKSAFEERLRSIVDPRKSSTPNTSFNDAANSSRHNTSARSSSIIVHENVSINEIQDGLLSEKLQQVVKVFCAGIRSSEGNVSMNVSLDYIENPNPSVSMNKTVDDVKWVDDKNEVVSKESPKKSPLSVSKSKSQDMSLREEKSLTERKSPNKLSPLKNRKRWSESINTTRNEELSTESTTNQLNQSNSDWKDTLELGVSKKERRSNSKSEKRLSQSKKIVDSNSFNKDYEEPLELQKEINSSRVKEDEASFTKLSKSREIAKEEKTESESRIEIIVEDVDHSEETEKKSEYEKEIEASNVKAQENKKGKNKKRNKRKHSTPISSENPTDVMVNKRMKLIGMKCEELSHDDLRYKLPSRNEVSDISNEKLKTKKLKRLQSKFRSDTKDALLGGLITDVKNRPRRLTKPSVVMEDNDWVVEEEYVKPSAANMSKCTFNFKKIDSKDFKNQMLYDPRIKREATSSLLRKKGYFL